jgi:hypothetical protein
MTQHGQLQTGNLIVGNEEIIFSAGLGESWIIKYTLDGNLLWRRAYRQSEFSFISKIHIMDDQSIVAVGTVVYPSRDPSAAWILKIENDGAPLWERLYAGKEPSNVMLAVCTDKYRRIHLAGFSGARYFGESKGWLLTLNDEGVKIKERLVDFKLADRFYCVAYSPSDYLICAGVTTDVLDGKRQAWVHRLE